MKSHAGKLVRLISAAAMCVAAAFMPQAAKAATGDPNPAPVQVFYAPLPEADVLTALTEIYSTAKSTKPSSPMTSYMSISVFVDGTKIYYDQWEDGYEADITNP